MISKLRYITRLLALACATVFGVCFLLSFTILVVIYFENSRRFPLFITNKDLVEVAVSGLLFVLFGTVYLLLARKPIRKRSDASLGSDG
jgi:uncharacterized BrkB/YihY/UPF0761 family membrane protein